MPAKKKTANAATFTGEIAARNEAFSGERAGVLFTNGVAIAEKLPARVASWFRDRGYHLRSR